MKRTFGIVCLAAVFCMSSLHAGGDSTGGENTRGVLDISDLNPAEVVQDLFTVARFHGLTPKPGFDSLSREEAAKALSQSGYSLKILKGRSMPIDITAGPKKGSCVIDTRIFNAWNGVGAAERAIAALRSRTQQNKQ